MLATKYKVWATGNPVGEGATGSIYVGITAIAKRAWPHMPLIVANELICNSLARAILLPCPPGFVIERGDVPHFVCLDFNLAGESLPPANPMAVASTLPELAWGVVLFDVWILNDDRHAKNLSFDSSTNDLQIFDHSHALMGPGADPLARMAAHKDNLAIGGHCLCNEITGVAGRDKWLARIASVPDYFVAEVVRAGQQVGLPEAAGDQWIDFLIQRRDHLPKLVADHMAQFPKIVAVEHA